MKRYMHVASIFVIAAAFLFAGCDIFQPPAASQQDIGEELAELQALIPMLEAGLAVATAEDVTLATASFAGRAAAQTVNAGVVLAGETPLQLYNAGTADAAGWVRFPSAETSYIENFYATTGNDAEFFIKGCDASGPGTAPIFRVKI